MALENEKRTHEQTKLSHDYQVFASLEIISLALSLVTYIPKRRYFPALFRYSYITPIGPNVCVQLNSLKKQEDEVRSRLANLEQHAVLERSEVRRAVAGLGQLCMVVRQPPP